MNSDLLKWLPLVAAAASFGWSKFIQKYSTAQTVTLSLLVGAAASIPYFTWQGGSMPAVNPGSSITDNSTASSASESSTAGSPTRQAMIKYMLDYDERTAAHLAMGGLPDEDVRRTAYNTLTNDELKVLYAFDLLMDSGQARPASGWQDDQFAQVAVKNNVDLSGLANISQLVTVAAAKVLKAEKNITQ